MAVHTYNPSTRVAQAEAAWDTKQSPSQAKFFLHVFVCLVWFFETGFLCVALAALKLAL